MSAHNGITFSAAYLWQLRTGAKDNPTIRHIEALARFFDVSPSYFFDDELTDLPEAELRLLAATKHGLPRATAASLVGLSDDSLDAVLQLTGRLRELEGLPCVSGVTENGDRNGSSKGAGQRNGKRHRVGSAAGRFRGGPRTSGDRGAGRPDDSAAAARGRRAVEAPQGEPPLRAGARYP